MRRVSLVGGPAGPVQQQIDWMHQALREIEKASQVEEVTATTLKALFAALTVSTAVDKADLVAGYDASDALPVQFTVENLSNCLLKGAFHVHRNGTNQTGATGGASNKTQFTTETFDVNGWFDNATNYRYQPTEAGKYLLYGTTTAATNTETPQARIFKNGSTALDGTYQTTGGAGIFISVVTGLLSLNGTTDYAEFFTYLPATVTTINGGSTNTFFGGARVSG